MSIWEPENNELFLQTEQFLEEQLIAAGHGARIGSLCCSETADDPTPRTQPSLQTTPVFSPLPSPPSVSTPPEIAASGSQQTSSTEFHNVLSTRLMEVKKVTIPIVEGQGQKPRENIDEEYDLVEDLSEIEILAEEEGEADVDVSEFVMI